MNEKKFLIKKSPFIVFKAISEKLNFEKKNSIWKLFTGKVISNQFSSFLTRYVATASNL